MSDKHINYIERHFLNENPSDGIAAFVCAEVKQQHESTRNSSNVSASLTISDCSRNITLDFSWFLYKDDPPTDKDVKSRMKKLALLKSVISRFEKEMKKAEKNSKKWLKSKKSSGATAKSSRETS